MPALTHNRVNNCFNGGRRLSNANAGIKFRRTAGTLNANATRSKALVVGGIGGRSTFVQRAIKKECCIPSIPKPNPQQVRVLDLTATAADLKGFRGGFASGGYGYFVPNYNNANNPGYHGKVARIDLATFSQVQVLDLTTTDTDLKGFQGGFASGDYGYFVPANNGAPFGKVARVDLA